MRTFTRGRAASTILRLAPRGNSTDPTRIAQAIAAMAGRGEVYLRPGTWAMGTAGLVLTPGTHDGTVVSAHPNAELAFSMALNGLNLNFGLQGYAVADLSVTSTTVHTTPTVGSASLVVDGSIAVGKWILVTRAGAACTAQLFRVLARSGAGPTWTLTLDVPIEAFSFAANDVVSGVTPLQGVRISGGKWTGTAARMFQFYGGYRNVSLTDLTIDGSFDWGAASFDFWGMDSRYQNVTAHNAIGNVTLATECNVAPQMTGCRSRGGTVYLSLSRRVQVSDLVADASASHGVELESAEQNSGADTSGTTGSLSNVTVNGAGEHGILITDGSIVEATNLTVRGATKHGVFAVNNSSVRPTLRLTNARAESCTLSGYDLAGCTAVLTACYGSGNGIDNTTTIEGDLRLGGSVATHVILDGFVSESPKATASIHANGSTTLRARNLRLGSTRSQQHFGIWIDDAGVVAEIDGYTYVPTAGQQHIAIRNGYGGTGGELSLSNASDGGIAAAGLQGYNGDVFRCGPNVRLTDYLSSTTIINTAGRTLSALAVSLGNTTGSRVCAGAAVGDVVTLVVDLAAGTDLTADFEATITVAGHIAQTGGTLSGITGLVSLSRG